MVEDLIDDPESFHDKAVGAFVRIRIAGSNQKQDLYRLVQVIGKYLNMFGFLSCDLNNIVCPIFCLRLELKLILLNFYYEQAHVKPLSHIKLVKRFQMSA